MTSSHKSGVRLSGSKLVARQKTKACKVVRPERFELPAFWFVARRSIQLS